jgi:excisionase family DNA binding protein
MTDRLRDADYIAERLGVPASWVYEAARRGDLPSIQCGRYRRFDDRDIDRFIEEQRAAESSSTERSTND